MSRDTVVDAPRIPEADYGAGDYFATCPCGSLLWQIVMTAGGTLDNIQSYRCPKCGNEVAARKPN